MNFRDFRLSSSNQTYERLFRPYSDSAVHHLVEHTHRRQCQIDFKHVDGNFATLSDARDAYQWPPKRKTVPTPTGALELEANASLAANQRVLDRLGQGLRDCLAAPAIDEVLLAQWIKVVLFWGGVYTRHRNGGGNAGWLDDRVQAEDLAVNLRAALAAPD